MNTFNYPKTIFASACNSGMGMADHCAFSAYFGGLMMENYAP
jgi:hypothetical protein